jgi:AraC-like DNA-binding protein
MPQSTSILTIIETKLLPWVLQDGMERFIVAHPRLKQMKAKSGITLLPKEMKGPRKAVRVYTFSGAKAIWPNDELVETHAPLLTFVLAGQADLHCGDYILQVPERYAVFVPGDVPRWTGVESLKHLGDNPHRFCDQILFLENSGSLHVWLARNRGNHRSPLAADGGLMIHDTRLLRLLEDMQQGIMAQRFNRSEICRRLLELFLLTLQRDLKENQAVFSWELASNETIQADAHNPVSRAQQYIREHLHEHLTQDKVARLVRLSRTQFIRRFHEETGQTFNQFVTACRMEQAKVLLLSTNFPLTFIYLSLGYKSSVHFNALFRKAAGMLPSEFRCSKKETNNNGA